MSGELGYRAWRLDQLDLREVFPEAWFRPAWDGADELLMGHTPYAVLGAAGGWPIATVAYHGRTGTWCCTCPAGIVGERACEHVAGVAYWIELDRLRQGYLDLSPHELQAEWGREVRRVRRIRSSLAPEPHGWRLRAAALFAALVARGLAVRPLVDADPIYELIEQQAREGVAA